MAFSFGQEADYSWSQFVADALTAAGQVSTASAGGTNPLPPVTPGAAAGTGIVYTPQGPVTTTPASRGPSTMLLFGLAAVLGLVLFMKRRR